MNLQEVCGACGGTGVLAAHGFGRLRYRYCHVCGAAGIYYWTPASTWLDRDKHRQSTLTLAEQDGRNFEPTREQS